MQVRFTKRADGRHRLTVVRDDGTASRGQVIPGLGKAAIPHDLLHAVVEKTLGLRRGVYGMVNAGLDIAELLDPAQKPALKAEAELMVSEIVTSLLQAETAYEGADATLFGGELRRRCAEARVREPTIDEDALGELRRLREDYEARWGRLAVGETLEVDIGGETA